MSIYSVFTILICLSCVKVLAQDTPPSADSLKKDFLDEVVVTGQFETQSIKHSVFRVRTISATQIRQKGATSVENILNSQLGVRFSNDLTLGESDIELMGMSGQNVKVLVDGIPVIDRGASKQSLSHIDVNNISRIEIVEGPMSVIYGTDALAGVVNIITKKNHEKRNLTISARIQEESAGKEYQAFRQEGTHNGNLAIDWTEDRWKARLSGSKNNFGGWKGNSPGRTLDWSPKDQWFTSLGLGYQTEAVSIHYGADFLHEDIYTPGPLNETNLRAVDKNYLTKRLNHVLKSEWKNHGRLSIQSSLSHQNYQRDTRTERLDFINGSSEPTSGAGEQDKAAFTSTMFRTTVQYALSETINLQPGFDIQRNSGSGERIMGSPTITDYAFFLSSELRLSNALTLRPGLRFIKNSVYDAPPVIPSLNAKLRLNNSLDLRAAYARGFRSPALRELFFTFVDANHSIAGNEALEAELSNSFNSYLTWYGSSASNIRFRSTIGGFYNQFQNLITLGTLPGNASANTYINIEEFRTAGASLENQFTWKNFSGTLGISYIGRYNRLSANEQSVPGMLWSPEASTELHYELPEWEAGINLFYKFNGKRPSYEVTSTAAEQTSITRTAIDPYHIADLTINKNLTSAVSLTGGIRNLFDITKIQNSATGEGAAHASESGQIPVSYGRSYFLGLTFQWSKNN